MHKFKVFKIFWVFLSEGLHKHAKNFSISFHPAGNNDIIVENQWHLPILTTILYRVSWWPLISCIYFYTVHDSTKYSYYLFLLFVHKARNVFSCCQGLGLTILSAWILSTPPDLTGLLNSVDCMTFLFHSCSVFIDVCSHHSCLFLWFLNNCFDSFCY